MASRDEQPTVAEISEYINAKKLTTWRKELDTVYKWWQPPEILSTRKTKTRTEEQTQEINRNMTYLKHMQNGWPSLVIRSFSQRGCGLIATTELEMGTIVCHYEGQILSGREATDYIKDQEADKSQDSSYLLGWKVDSGRGRQVQLCIDGKADDASQGRLINHSNCHANVKRVSLTINQALYCCFQVCDPIYPGDELLYDYGQRSQGGVHPDWLDRCPCWECDKSRFNQ